MRLMGLIAVGVVVLTADGAAARCGFAPYSFNFGRDSATTGTCDAKGISGHLGAGGNAGTAFTKLEVVEAAKHGRVLTRGLSTYDYLPEKGYKGPDQFALRICGTSRHGPGCSKLTYSFVVQ